MDKSRTRILALTAVFAAVAVVGSVVSFPVLGSKCSPVQHLVNILGAVFLGPFWNTACAFVASVIRNMTGLGTPLAFPGSMCGAFLSAVAYKYFRNLPSAWFGELFGTGIIGGMLSYPVAAFILGSKSAALFTFVVPFLVSSGGGTVIAAIVTIAMKKFGMIDSNSAKE